MSRPDFSFELSVLQRAPGAVVAGVDEAGRGPLAGPVVAAAVIFNIEATPLELRRALDDSKRLSPVRREDLYGALFACAAATIGIGQANVDEIDSINILNATFRAMERAVAALACAATVALVDGNRAPHLKCEVQTIIRGDGKSLSIAAASIVAKVTRDRLMVRLAAMHPGYGWENNMGYGTREHCDAIERLGVTPHHRRSFAPVRAQVDARASQIDAI